MVNKSYEIVLFNTYCFTIFKSFNNPIGGLSGMIRNRRIKEITFSDYLGGKIVPISIYKELSDDAFDNKEYFVTTFT